MNDKAFNALKEKLIQGDTTALGELYIQYKGYCIGILKKRFSCANDKAGDIYMDAILQLRTKLIQGTIENKNLEAYVGKICQNLFLQDQRASKKMPSTIFKVEEVEKYLSFQKRNELQDPLIIKEEESTLSATHKRKVDAIIWAKAQLGEQCRKILVATIVDGVKAKDLYLHFGMKSLAVFKTTKSRCKKKLEELVKEFIGTQTQKNDE